MKKDSHYFHGHLFVCTNKRANGKDCASKGGERLRDEIKAHYKEKGLNGFRVNASGCLGRCEEGIACVLYPQGIWFTELSGQDSAKLAAKLIEQIDLHLDKAID